MKTYMIQPSRLIIIFIIIPIVAGIIPVYTLSAVESESPTDVVKRLIGIICAIKDEESILSPSEKKENTALKKKASEIIDIRGLSEHALAKHWDKRDEKEKKAFELLLTKLFEKIAYPKSGKFFVDLEMLYKEERIVKDKAMVRTSIIHKKEGNISIDFKLHLVNGRWLLWDIVLDDVSLGINLKTQFNQIITKNSYQELVRRMNERLENR